LTPESVALGSTAALLGIWLGYPLCVWLAAGVRGFPRRRSDPVGTTRQLPTVTVILATRESAEAVRARIDDLLQATYPADLLDVVVGLDLGAKCTAENLADLAPRVRVVLADNPGGKACALNRAVRSATGDVLVFADTFQRFSPDAISNLVQALDDRATGVATGALYRGRTESRWHPVDWYWRLERWLRLQESELHASVGVTGAIYALRHDDWTPLPENLILDDLFVPMRLVLDGYRVRFVPNAIAQDSRTVANKDEFRRKVRTLTGNFQLCAWQPRVLSPVRNPIWLQFVCHKLLRLLTPYLLLALLGSLLVLGVREIGLHLALVSLAWTAVVSAFLASRLNPSATVRALVLSFILMPAAALVATWNAVARNWSVWGQPAGRSALGTPIP
jgi:cellulose synthase/poly-beta-1,6-N-acetylglucosamine synthase-like glycosyltransferase